MTGRVILVGRRADGGHRDRLWSWCRRRWERHLGWPVVEGHHDGPGPFSLAAASNRAAAAAGGWSVALYVGGDAALGNRRQAELAADLAEQKGMLAFAHDHLTLLDADATDRLLRGAPLAGAASGGERHPNTFSSAFAVPRELWDEAGGFDERFVGWGWEDLSFWSACCALAGGFERVRGEAYHLWHPAPREEREGSPLHAANEALGRRYLGAKGDRDAMLAILRERGES